ncbi:MAG: M28 family peptidase [Saprospiraceae bacterium]
MRTSLYIWIILIGVSAFLSSCKSDATKKSVEEVKTIKPAAKIPRVDADTAYYFIKKQLEFGVRVPGTNGHAMAKDWIANTMKSFGASVEIQEFKATFLTKKDIPSYNIIASINPNHKERVILFAHWDSRLIAEKDKDQSKKELPIMGAIDGASGVAALLEIARQITMQPIDLGVDFVFFDAEDQGSTDEDSWCLGSQHWAKNYRPNGPTPKFGILLDLIGAKDATYFKEGISAMYAKNIQDKVWDIAQKMGKANLFQNSEIGGITDDHYYVNTIAKIPTIDIIQTYPSGMFGTYHHTHDDNIDAVDKENLAAVTQVVLAVLYKNSDGTF